jgi:guanylate kinase
MESIFPQNYLFVVSGPSGVGKTTTCNLIIEDKSLNLVKNITYTTRQIRSGEKDGEDYHFVSREKFQDMINQGKMLEYNEFAGNFYGTSRDSIDLLRQEHNVLSIVEVNGKNNIEKYYKSIGDKKIISIFFLPPSFEDLKTRLTERNDSAASIEKRLSYAKNEMDSAPQYDERIITESVDQSIRDLTKIFNKYI